jgi:hypothetical protein
MTRLYYKLFACFSLLLIVANSTVAQKFNWAKRIGYPAIHNGANGATSLDKYENVYVAGFSYGMNTYEVNGSKIQLPSAEDGFFVIKYDSSGKALWLRDIADRVYDINNGSGAEITSSAIDNGGNLWITGFYHYGIIFKGITRKDTFYNESAYQDFFIAKYNAVGELLWAKNGGAKGTHERGAQLALDASGNCYVIGRYERQMDFGDGLNLRSQFSSAGATFLAKYAANGKLLWVRRAEGTSYSYTPKLVLNTQGDPYIAGTHHSTASFGGSNQQADTTIKSDKLYNNFLVKFSKTGNFEWVKTIGSGEHNEFASIKGITADYKGDVYLAGYHTAATTFKRIGSPDTVLPQQTHFLGKYTSEGKLIWVTGFEAHQSFGSQLAVDKANGLYIFGTYSDNIIFNKSKATQVTLTSNGFSPIVIAYYEHKGEFKWASKIISNRQLYSADIAIGSNGKVYITGHSVGKEGVDFGNITLPGDNTREENDLTYFISSFTNSQYTGNVNMV